MRLTIIQGLELAGNAPSREEAGALCMWRALGRFARGAFPKVGYCDQIRANTHTAIPPLWLEYFQSASDTTVATSLSDASITYQKA